MKYLKLFCDAFMEGVSKEAGVQFAMLLVWIWRGMYFGFGVLIILWLMGLLHR